MSYFSKGSHTKNFLSGTGMALIALGLSTGTSFASVIQQTVTLNAAQADLSSTVGSNGSSIFTSNGAFSFNPFDTTLGTLTSVQLVRTGTLTFGGSLTNSLSTDETFTFLGQSVIEIIGDPAGTFGTDLFKFLPYGGGTSMTIGAGQTTALALSQTTASNTFTVPAANFANFEGGAINFDVQTGVTDSIFQGAVALDGIEQSVNAASSGSYQLSYTFTPNVTGVPEPASLALLAMSLLGMGVIRRRRNGV